jgi:diaminopimelate epimerase
MGDVSTIERIGDAVYLDTGSPHYVKIVDDLLEIDLVNDARIIRYNNRFSEEGTNVNFVEIMDGITHIRTYERGVEDETLSCGTGATAVAIAMNYLSLKKRSEIPIKVLGGKLNVSFQSNADGSYSNVWLTGPVTQVFEGSTELPE